MNKIKPALSAEEWENEALDCGEAELTASRALRFRADKEEWNARNRLGIAALALCGHLTWEGYDAIRGMLDHAERFLASRLWDDVEYARLDRARAEVEKIAALLPPRKP